MTRSLPFTVRPRLLLGACVALVAAIIVIGTLVVPGSQSHAGSTPAPVAGHPAPNFTLSPLGRHALALDSLRGNVVLLNFWATWCIPCRSEVPRLESWYRRYRNRHFVVVGVDRQEPQSDVRDFTTRRQVTYPVSIDGSGSILAQYHVVPLPASFLIDTNGIIRSVKYGALDDAYFRTTILPLLSR